MNAFCTANGFPVIRASISRPRIGAWHADLEVDARDPASLSGSVRVELAGGAVALQGTARRAGAVRGLVAVRVIAGAGGLPTVIPAKAYQGVPLRLPLQDVVADAGEQLSPASDGGVLGTSLANWVRTEQRAGVALAALLRAVGDPAWRIADDGAIWVGPEQWPAASLTCDVVEEDPAHGRVEISSDQPTLAPGQTFLDRRVSHVEHRISPDRIRHAVWFEEAAR
jgi:hypothetical protein